MGLIPVPTPAPDMSKADMSCRDHRPHPRALGIRDGTCHARPGNRHCVTASPWLGVQLLLLPPHYSHQPPSSIRQQPADCLTACGQLAVTDPYTCAHVRIYISRAHTRTPGGSAAQAGRRHRRPKDAQVEHVGRRTVAENRTENILLRFHDC